MPAWPYPAAAAAVPAWFTSSNGARALPAGSTALVYPVASSSNDQSMLWQAMANMEFTMPGGFAVIPGPNGANTFNGQASPLQEALATCEGGGVNFVTGITPTQLLEPVERSGRRTPWSWSRSAPGAACAENLFTQALGPPQHKGGVLVWPRVEQKTN